tara:strand:- start:10029 stop:10544 length:516 start_codon:yes stop_codon:yes gene_type:complete
MKHTKKQKNSVLKYNEYFLKLHNLNINESLAIYEEYSKQSKFNSFKNFIQHKASDTKTISKNLITAFKHEGLETRDMISVFNRQLRKKLNLKDRSDNPSPKELKDALTQLKDIPKLLPYAAIMLAAPIPGSSTLYTVFAYYLNKKTDGKINILPDSFKDVLNIHKDSKTKV